MTKIEKIYGGFWCRQYDIELPDELYEKIKSHSYSGLEFEHTLYEMIESKAPKIKVLNIIDTKVDYDDLERICKNNFRKKDD